jgi:hypothetical protein
MFKDQKSLKIPKEPTSCNSKKYRKYNGQKQFFFNENPVKICDSPYPYKM